MNQRQRVIAALTSVFVLLFAVGGAIVVSQSGAQQRVETGSGSPGPQGTNVTTTPAPTGGTNVPPATTAERNPEVTPEQCSHVNEIGHDATRDQELQDAGVTPANCAALLYSLCQAVNFDAVRQMGEQDPKGKCTAIMAGVSTTQNNAPTSTAPSGTAAPSSSTSSSAPPGSSPPGSAPSGTASSTTSSTAAPSTTQPPRQPDVVDFIIYLQKVAQAEGRLQGVGVTCEVNCILRDGIMADTPEAMFAELTTKGVNSPAFLDDAARTVSFQTGRDYTDTRSVGDPGKAASDLLIVATWITDPNPTPAILERGILPAGTHLVNTVVQGGTVVQFDYVLSKDRYYIKIWKGDTYLLYLDTCGNRGSETPTPGVPKVPQPPELPPESTIPPTTQPPSTPPPTGGPTTSTTPPTSGKYDTHPAGPQSPTPTQVQGPGPTHPAGPPNPGINPGQPNPTTGCNPSPCQGATTTTTRATPPSSAPVQPSQPKPSTPTTMGEP